MGKRGVGERKRRVFLIWVKLLTLRTPGIRSFQGLCVERNGPQCTAASFPSGVRKVLDRNCRNYHNLSHPAPFVLGLIMEITAISVQTLPSAQYRKNKSNSSTFFNTEDTEATEGHRRTFLSGVFGRCLKALHRAMRQRRMFSFMRSLCAEALASS